MQMLGKSDGEMLKGEAPDGAIWKPDLALDFIARHSLDFWLTSEDLIRAEVAGRDAEADHAPGTF
jgi:hypothetical protein